MENKKLELLEKITRAIDPRLLTTAQLVIKKSEAKSKTYDRLIMNLESNSYRMERPSSEVSLARVKVRGTVTYISVSEKFKPLLEKLQLQNDRKDSDPFRRIDLDYFMNLFDTAENKVSILFNEIIVNSLDYSPFDCCSRYMECSNAKECVHPDYLYASCACNYKKQLDSGRIFYGDNRNI